VASTQLNTAQCGDAPQAGLLLEVGPAVAGISVAVGAEGRDTAGLPGAAGRRTPGVWA
jgi:hypothetical protein